MIIADGVIDGPVEIPLISPELCSGRQENDMILTQGLRGPLISH